MKNHFAILGFWDLGTDAEKYRRYILLEFFIHLLQFLLCARARLGGNPEFARRKVEVSSEESQTLLGGKFRGPKRHEKGWF